jgi:hypothetical protein
MARDENRNDGKTTTFFKNVFSDGSGIYDRGSGIGPAAPPKMRNISSCILQSVGC